MKSLTRGVFFASGVFSTQKWKLGIGHIVLEGILIDTNRYCAT